MAPDVEPVRDSLSVKNLRKTSRRMRRLEGALAGGDHDAAVMLQRMQRAVRESRQKPRGVIEEAVLVRIPAQIRGSEIVESAHSDQRVEQVRPAEERVGGVERAEARTGGGDALRSIAHRRADVGYYLLFDVP